MSSVEASLAGPKRPQDRVALGDVPKAFAASGELEVNHLQRQRQPVDYTLNGHHYSLPDGAVAIAAITSCTNTSNPSVLMAAGLLAKKAVERGLQPQPWVKASLARGLESGVGLSGPCRPDALPRPARLQSGGIWLHHLYW